MKKEIFSSFFLFSLLLLLTLTQANTEPPSNNLNYLPKWVVEETLHRITHPPKGRPTMFLDHDLDGSFHGYSIGTDKRFGEQIVSFVFNHRTSTFWTNAWEQEGQSGTFVRERESNGKLWLHVSSSAVVGCTAIVVVPPPPSSAKIKRSKSRRVWLSCFFGHSMAPSFLSSFNVGQLATVPPHVRPFALWRAKEAHIPATTISMLDVSNASNIHIEVQRGSSDWSSDIMVTTTTEAPDNTLCRLDMYVIPNGAGDSNSIAQSGRTVTITKHCPQQPTQEDIAKELCTALNQIQRCTTLLLKTGLHRGVPLQLYDAYSGNQIWDLPLIRATAVIMVVFLDEPYMWPGIQVGHQRLFKTDSHGLNLTLTTISLRPRLFELEGLLRSNDTQQLRAEQRQRQHLLVDDFLQSPARISTGSLLTSIQMEKALPTFQSLLDDLSLTLHLPHYQELTSPRVLQFVQYEQHGKFAHHYDVPFEPEDCYSYSEERGRLLTLFIYLNNATGSTNFPFSEETSMRNRYDVDLLRQCHYGTNVQPQESRSLLWYNLRPSDLRRDPWSYHGACKVNSQDGKEAMNVWFQLPSSVMMHVQNNL
jgi:hypothetical protein